MPLDTTVTFVEDRETGKTAAKIMGGRLASSKPNQVQDGLIRDTATIVARRGMVLVPTWREKTSAKPLVKPVEFATNYTIWQRCASRDLPT